MTTMKIAVLGSGANGSSVGADLTRDGLDVTLIEQWPAHVEAIRTNGLTIEMASETLHVRPKVMHLCEVATLRERFDAVLVLMKAYDTRWATQLIEPYLADDGVVAGVQNGMSTQAIADVVGAHRTMGTVIEISSTMTEPGVVRRHADRSRSWFAVGALSPEGAPHEQRVADLLSHSGTVQRVDDILATKWMKLVSNSSVLVPTAIAGAPMLDAIDLPGLRDIMIRAGQEALETGRALGHPVLPIFGLTPEEVSQPETVVEILLDRLYVQFVVPKATTTVLQDWTKGRHSEVDDINGTVVAGGARTGVATPVNAAIVDVAHRIERGELDAGPAGLDALRGLVE